MVGLVGWKMIFAFFETLLNFRNDFVFLVVLADDPFHLEIFVFLDQ